jgi:hypothetical protein
MTKRSISSDQPHFFVFAYGKILVRSLFVELFVIDSHACNSAVFQCSHAGAIPLSPNGLSTTFKPWTRPTNVIHNEPGSSARPTGLSHVYHSGPLSTSGYPEMNGPSDVRLDRTALLSLLTDHERGRFRRLCDQYSMGNLEVNTLFDRLIELLNTSEKVRTACLQGNAQLVWHSDHVTHVPPTTMICLFSTSKSETVSQMSLAPILFPPWLTFTDVQSRSTFAQQFAENTFIAINRLVQNK